MECYRDVLTIDPEEATAKERLGALTAAMERQVCGVWVCVCGAWETEAVVKWDALSLSCAHPWCP